MAGPVPGLVGCINILLTAALTAGAQPLGVALLALYWVGYAGWMSTPIWREFWHRLQFLRWFLLALAMLYGGSALLAPAPARSALLLLGLQQMGVLLVLLLAVTCVLQPLTIPQRVTAFTHLLTPLRWCGLEPQRIGRMLALALDEALRQRSAWQSQMAAGPPSSRLWDRVIDTVAQACLSIESQGIPPPSGAPEPTVRRPPWLWLALLPLALAVLVHGVITFG